MFASIYTALAGMNAYSQGLNVISNNVANLNTPGFKVSDPLFREIVYRQIQASEGNGGGLRPQGAGVASAEAGISFSQGELRETGNSLDAAIDGSGFFVLQNEDGTYRYTRAGQLTFNDDGVLVERSTGAKVLVSTADTSGTFFDINAFRVEAPRATTTVTLSGALARTSTSGTYELQSITVYDAAGTPVPLRARFTRNPGDSLRWTVEILGAANAVLGSGTVVFNADGTPAQNSNTVKVPVTAAGGQAFEVTFNFGAENSITGVASLASSTTSSLQVVRQDGAQIGSLTSTAFDDRGQLKLTYSNGVTRTAATVLRKNLIWPSEMADGRNCGMIMAC